MVERDEHAQRGAQQVDRWKNYRRHLGPLMRLARPDVSDKRPSFHGPVRQMPCFLAQP